jgi:hypothetical protein
MRHNNVVWRSTKRETRKRGIYFLSLREKNRRKLIGKVLIFVEDTEEMQVLVSFDQFGGGKGGESWLKNF